jgi:lipopolysaccharide transport system permease protein
MLRRGASESLGYLRGVWEYRYFWMSLVKAELQRRYRRSTLGLGWSLLQPICMTLVLAAVYRRLFGMGFAEFAPILLTGLSFWNFVSSTTLLGCSSLLSAESYIRQQCVPLAIFPLRTVLTAGFHFLVSLSVTLVFVWLIQGPANPLTLLALVPTLLLLFLFGWSVAILVGLAHVYFADTQHLAEVGLQVLLYLTPVLYPPALLAQTRLAFLLHASPLALFLELLRLPILDGAWPPLSLYAEACAVVALFAGLASWTLARLEHRLVFAL